jgi:hypothetical protein
LTPQRFAQRVRDELRARRWLRWHCSLIASVTLLTTWTCSHALMRLGTDALSVRYGVAFAAAYATLLLLLYLWARWLLSRDEGDWLQLDGGGGDGSGVRLDCALDAPIFRSGGGGDFGGAGGGDSFELPDANGAGEAAGSLFEAAGSADEGALVLVPLALVVGVALAIGAVLGFVVFGLFGVDLLLAVAVEVAIASVGGALAYKAGAEGWLGAAWRRTRTAALIGLIVLVSLGAAIDRWMPEARSLPHAVRLLTAL